MTFTASLPVFRLSSVVQCSTQRNTVTGSIPARAKIFITVFLSFYSLVFIVICNLFSLTFILITTSTPLCYVKLLH